MRTLCITIKIVQKCQRDSSNSRGMCLHFKGKKRVETLETLLGLKSQRHQRLFGPWRDVVMLQKLE